MCVVPLWGVPPTTHLGPVSAGLSYLLPGPRPNSANPPHAGPRSTFQLQQPDMLDDRRRDHVTLGVGQAPASSISIFCAGPGGAVPKKALGRAGAGGLRLV
jgi:hypothetical protein